VYSPPAPPYIIFFTSLCFRPNGRRQLPFVWPRRFCQMSSWVELSVCPARRNTNNTTISCSLWECRRESLWGVAYVISYLVSHISALTIRWPFDWLNCHSSFDFDSIRIEFHIQYYGHEHKYRNNSKFPFDDQNTSGYLKYGPLNLYLNSWYPVRYGRGGKCYASL